MPAEVEIVIVPYDSGRRGWRMGRGPDALLARGIANVLRSSDCEVSEQHLTVGDDITGAEIHVAFELQRLVAERVTAAAGRGAFPIVLSGNCNAAVGTFSGLAAAGSKPCVVWLDAHGDMNTPETTTSGFLDGMALAMLTGRCWRSMTAQVPGFASVPDEDLLMIGMHDLDAAEREVLEASAITVCSRLMNADNSLPAAASHNGVYLHVDLDVLDPLEGRANGYAKEGGLTQEALLGLVARISKATPIRALGLSAYDPECDVEGTVSQVMTDIAQIVIGSWRGYAH